MAYRAVSKMTDRELMAERDALQKETGLIFGSFRSKNPKSSRLARVNREIGKRYDRMWRGKGRK